MQLPLEQSGQSLNKIMKTISALEQKYQRELTAEELADSMGVTCEEIQISQRNEGQHLSMDAPFIVGEDNSLLDVHINSDADVPDAYLMPH